MSPRLRRKVDAYKVHYEPRAKMNPIWLIGMIDGYKEAMRTMYPNADEFMGQEPAATDLVLKVLALEELRDGAVR